MEAGRAALITGVPTVCPKPPVGQCLHNELGLSSPGPSWCRVCPLCPVLLEEQEPGDRFSFWLLLMIRGAALSVHTEGLEPWDLLSPWGDNQSRALLLLLVW